MGKKKLPHLEQGFNGDWIYPKRRGYIVGCCDCGLIHRFNFAYVKRGKGIRIVFQVFREDELTKKNRKREKFKNGRCTPNPN